MCFNVWQGYRKQEWPFYYKLAPTNCDGDTLNIEEPPNGHLPKAATSSFPGWLDTSTGGGPKCHPPWILQAKDKGAICVSTLSGNTLAWRLSNVNCVRRHPAILSPPLPSSVYGIQDKSGEGPAQWDNICTRVKLLLHKRDFAKFSKTRQNCSPR